MVLRSEFVKMKPTLPVKYQPFEPLSSEFVMRTFDVRQETFILWAVGNEPLEGAAYHGVLAHQDNGVASEVGSNFVHLLG
jgi:hypothetical protein